MNGLDNAGEMGIIKIKRRCDKRLISFQVRFLCNRKPSLARVAVFAFLYDNGNGKVTDMESNTHMSTPFRKGVDQPPAVVQRLQTIVPHV